MARQELMVRNVGAIGTIRDTERHLIPPNAWTQALNVELYDGVAHAANTAELFTTPSVAPYFVVPVRSGGSLYWVYAGLAKAYVWDNSTHTDITRTSGGDYSANAAREFNGTVHGGILVFTNGNDDPQEWPTASAATALQDLSNWPASTTCRVIRSLGAYLVALNITEGGTQYEHRVKWSHPSSPGSVPSSWDETDATKDAGEYDLPDVNSGAIIDAQPLGGQLYIYKATSMWRMWHVGGSAIMAFRDFPGAGVLADRCVTATPKGAHHFVLTEDYDLITHDGTTIESRATSRWRRYLRNSVDSTNYINSFLYTNPMSREVIVCFPTAGNTTPNMAVVWNEDEDTLTEREVSYVDAVSGRVAASLSGTWNSDSNTWESDTSYWNDPVTKSVIAADAANTKLLKLNSGLDFAGTDLVRLLQRTGMAYSGVDRRGDPIFDETVRKMIDRVWIQAKGDPFTVRLGSHETYDGVVSWSNAVTFDPSMDKYVDIVKEGPFYAIEFSSVGSQDWTIEGYKMEMDIVGEL